MYRLLQSAMQSMTSSLIASSIPSALHHLDTKFHNRNWDWEFALKFGLRNLKVLLIIGSRMLGDARFLNSSSSLPSLFSRIEVAIARILKDRIYDMSKREILKEVSRLVEEVDAELYAAPSGSPLLTVEDVVAIADSTLENCLHFLQHIEKRKIELEVIDGFRQEIQFLRNFLVFAKHTGVQLHNLLILIKPVVIGAARVFVQGEYTEIEVVEKVASKCLDVNGMAADFHQIYHAYTQALSTSIGELQYAGMDDGVLIHFLDSLISHLWDVLRHSDSTQAPFIAVYANLRFCRAFLKERPISFDGKIKGQIGGWIRDAGSLICSLHQTTVEIDVGQISDLLQGFDVIEAQIQATPAQTSESSDFVFGDHSTNTNIFHADEKDLKLHEETHTANHQPPKTTAPQVVGFQDTEVQTVLDRLTRGSKQLRIVPIYGMAGIGKTTFALKLYNHHSIRYHFQAQAWCSISQVLDKKKLLVQLLNQIHDQFGSYSEMTEDDLANHLRRRLKGKRYLVLLDDVWTLDVWNTLKTSFPDDSTQSRIIITSRHCDIAPPGLLDGEPHPLRLRENHECLEILQMKLSSEGEWNPDIGLEFAKLCKGLPLMAVIVAGLLATIKQDSWEGIVDHLSSCGVSREEQCISSLELSFKHLPDDLKLCFLYIGAFPEDEKVSVKRLIRLWTAEGFVKKNGLKTSEDVGREYLENLIKRNLVMVADSTSTGGAKSCWIHDIMRDFCLTKARKENSFHILHGDDQLSDFNEPRCLQRLCIHTMRIHFQNAKLFCPRAHSLLLFSPESYDLTAFDMSFIIQIFKLLKVLDLQQFGLVAEIPSEIGALTRLTYLSVQSRLPGIPYSIGNLSNLETLITNTPMTFEVISFPDTLWNLQKLKYLQLHRWNKGFYLPIENSCNMLELETLSGVVFNSDGSMEKQLKNFLNIRSLKCRILPDVESTVKLSKIVVPDSLHHLRSLTISGQGKLQCEFGSIQKLRKVTLSGFELSREEIAVIGKFPNLQVLKLLSVTFSGGTLEMEEGEFSKLKIFLLCGSANLWSWTASDEQLPSLQKLNLSFCTSLEEIPSTCLETCLELEEIEVDGCSSTLESLIRAIEAVHEDFGNFVKVSIRSIQLV